MRVTLSASHGAITLNSQTNFVSIAGNGSGNVTVTGSLSAINSVLNDISYRIAADYSGSDTICITAADMSTSASGQGSIDINKASVNYFMFVSAPQALSAAAGVECKYEGIFITYLNSVHDNMEAVISASHGTLSLPSVSGLEYACGNSAGSMTLAGSLDSINSALATLDYTSATDYSGAESIKVDAQT